MEHLSVSDDMEAEFYNMFEEEPQRTPPKQTRQSNIWDIPESPPVGESGAGLEDDPDCPFEITHDASDMEGLQLEPFSQQAEEDDWDPNTQNQPPPELARGGPVESLKDICQYMTCLDRQMQSVIAQQKKQGQWIGKMQPHISTMAQRYDEIPHLKSRLDKIQEQMHNYCGNGEAEESAVEPTGRQKRATKRNCKGL